MTKYPRIQQDGYCASISTARAATGRWRAWVTLERDSVYARLKSHQTPEQAVPNSYPSEESAVQAAYARARDLIAHMVEEEHA